MVRELDTIDARTLLEEPFEAPRWVVEGLLPTGINIIAGSPKVGKSWLALDLATHVASGDAFWGMATRRCGVLYLCLEDTYPRVQRRLWHLVDEVEGELSIAVSANSIPDGLTEQMGAFAAAHPGLGLVIVDTLQMVRRPTRDSAYASDYGDVAALKRFADEAGVALVAIHHTRKLGDPDSMNTVSGTTGITGCADSTLILEKDGRESSAGTLRVMGRDVEYQELRLRFRDCRWELVERAGAEELEERSVPEDVRLVLGYMLGREEDWSGTIRELAFLAGVKEVPDALFGKHLAQQRGFMADRGVSYARRHTKSGAMLSLQRVRVGDGSDGDDGKKVDTRRPVTSVTAVTAGPVQGSFFEAARG